MLSPALSLADVQNSLARTRMTFFYTSMASAAQRLEASQDRKREGDVHFGRGSFEQAATVYRDAGALLDDPAGSGPGVRCARRCACVFGCVRAWGTLTAAGALLRPRRRRRGSAQGGRDAHDPAAEPRGVLPQARGLCRRRGALHGRCAPGAARRECTRTRSAGSADARAAASPALRYEPQAEQVLLLRGRCQMAIGDYVAAYGDYWDLAELKPDALEPQRQLQAIAAVCPEAPEVCCWGCRVGARAR